MCDLEIPLPRDVSAGFIEGVFDDAIARSGLKVTLRDSLRKFPGCVHWHLKRGREPGTLELTLWPRQHRAWFSVHSGRAAPWVDDEMKRLVAALHERLPTRDETL